MTPIFSILTTVQNKKKKRKKKVKERKKLGIPSVAFKIKIPSFVWNQIHFMIEIWVQQNKTLTIKLENLVSYFQTNFPSLQEQEKKRSRSVTVFGSSFATL